MKGKERSILTRTLVASLSLLFITGSTLAKEAKKDGSSNSKPTTAQVKAAGCAPATHRVELDLNNVRALIETGGNMWQDRATGDAAYEVPKTEDRSGPKAIYAGALWMGGISPDNQLKLAAVTFRNDGDDFWPGPLTNTGDASVTPEVCLAYDRTWRTKLTDVELHTAFFECQANPDCDEADEYPNYIIPQDFFEWPAHGDINLNQDFNLAPFNDFGDSPNGFYDPTEGDSPGFDLDGVIDCRNKFREDPVPLFGDDNIWWVFNDKGDNHTETGGQSIGMEIRAQAFAFSTNDEVNNMTFYNYVLINQGTQRLQDTYFGQWVDPDLGRSDDDYVGCDVQRGLGYCYNGDNDDESGQQVGYGPQPPAVGVDFFEGPFVDYDSLDNPLTLDCAAARLDNGIPYKGIGIGYGDSVIDNERFGMRAFLYYNIGGGIQGDPDQAVEYYSYLRSLWLDGADMVYGGNGHPQNAPTNLPAAYMFPGDSDPVGWGTDCLPQTEWTEQSAGNPAGDRRFIQSAGPFTLEPGAYNNITVGVVWARATGGGAFESVNRVREADDKAQALFDNCFRILDGPDAPDLAIQELDRELIIYITNPPTSNNFNEEYVELDPTIAGFASDPFYRFQGYRLYQLKDEDVGVEELSNIDRARLVAQVDIDDDVTRLINYINDPNIGLPVPTLMADSVNDGIKHSIRVTEDLFAEGDQSLVNFKTYYYMAIAYAFNEYEEFNPNPNILTGQAFPFLAGRKSASGSIRSYSGIPHKPTPENGGTVQAAQYGEELSVTRVEGRGNGGRIIDMDLSSEGVAVTGDYRVDEITYKAGLAPISVKVVDPLNVPFANLQLMFLDSVIGGIPESELDDGYWALIDTDFPNDTIFSDQLISIGNEQLLTALPPASANGRPYTNLGLSIAIKQYDQPSNDYNEFLGSEITFEDPTKEWYLGIPDGEGQDVLNWIRSGTSSGSGSYTDFVGKDDDEHYEGVVTRSTVVGQFGGEITGGTWAPWPLVGDTAFQPSAPTVVNTQQIARLDDMSSVLVVITPDKGKWTRAAVLEQQENSNLSQGGADKMELRAHASIDKEGRVSGDPGYNDAEGTFNGDQPTGMGWFPGYAINLETGERLNMAYGEDSFWGGPEGVDMLWNPTTQVASGLGAPIMGGSHWIYVFRNREQETGSAGEMPMYDEGQYLYDRLSVNATPDRLKVWRSCDWVGSALLAEGHQLLETEVRIRINVGRNYKAFRQPFPGYTPEVQDWRNEGRPMYTFSTEGRTTVVMDQTVEEEALDLIGVVPNPYYAYSTYERNRLDKRVKFINLPQVCTISIYNVSGTLVRRFRKDNELTYLDWDLNNGSNVPIAGGLYICHVDVPDVGEKVLKWFGVIRPVDLQNF